MSQIDLDRINVLIGPNNAGKSSVLRGISLIQAGTIGNIFADIRLGAKGSTIEIGLADVDSVYPIPKSERGTPVEVKLEIRISREGEGGKWSRVLIFGKTRQGVDLIPDMEPGHFLVPYLSKRKTTSFNEDVSEKHALKIESQFTHLAAKLSRLGNPHFPGYDRYAQTCRAILGFVVTAVPSTNGQRPGVYLPDRSKLYIDQMGEGVPNIVGLLVDLSLSDGKLFLVEEPENDLHPTALKALLDLMVESSERNQFIVSTHSNIVARHLGAAAKSRLYYIDSKPDVMPTEATIRIVDPTPEARLEVLRELGYSFSDLDLWDGWLILEESSAERIVRDYLIPWFAPKLARVRTLATGGNSQMEPTFEDFHRLVRFTHLEPVYRHATWVLVDGDEEGRNIVSRLRERYPTWNQQHFAWFDAPNFERYYPRHFAEEVAQAIQHPNRNRRREAKKKLLERVRKWLDENEVRGRAALEESASEVIAKLQLIEAELSARTTGSRGSEE